LEFNERVLAQASEQRVPVLERAKFLAIASSNLDEFFQVRVAALKDQVDAGVNRPGADGLTPANILVEISERVHALVNSQEDLFDNHVRVAMSAADISIETWDALSDDDRKVLGEVFELRVFPVLTPLAVDPGHPFPYISNLSLNLGVRLLDPDTEERRFARVKMPPLLPRFLPLPDSNRFVPLEQVIAAKLGRLFPGMDVEAASAFRVTRDADLTLEDEDADDLLAAVEIELRRRRFGRAVRLEVANDMPNDMLDFLLEELDLDRDDVTFVHTLIDLTGLFILHGLDKPLLKDEPWKSVLPTELSADDTKSIFAVLRERDVLVHHPYESFAGSVQAFIERASQDPLVQSIKMTLYRTSGDSPIAASLIRAAERGVQVAVLVELKARFDEQTNVTWAKALERAGVHVVYGLVGLKTHSKCVLVVRNDADGLRRYVHIGTGNYNSKTARLYEDLGLLTTDPEIGADVGDLFNHLTGFSRNTEYRRLLVAPHQLRMRLLDLIKREIAYGDGGRITLKMNSLADPEMIEALYAASCAGVKIDLLIRGICCLRPGVAEMSENITVRSILGRYLEHSRILRFAHGSEGTPLYLIGSADWMGRNLDRRVEVMAPVRSPRHQSYLDGILAAELSAAAISWQLGEDAAWKRSQSDNEVDVQYRIGQLLAGSLRR
jgi:polyphosphate kinase